MLPRYHRHKLRQAVAAEQLQRRYEEIGLEQDGAILNNENAKFKKLFEEMESIEAELKARGLEVTLYPFIFMDVPADNGLPDPYGEAEQAAYPWRGRVKGDDGAAASADVAALFGAESGWGLRRLALHYARLAAECGADGLLIGSEMRGLTWTRDAIGGFPAVAAFRTLVADCRAVVGQTVKLSYAADWSEYSGWREGSDVIFHLDPLWADPDSDSVGIDWYPPLADWRDGDGGLDGGSFSGPDVPMVLRRRWPAARALTGSMRPLRIGLRNCARRSLTRRTESTGRFGARI